jgi:hypothetical protein
MLVVPTQPLQLGRPTHTLNETPQSGALVVALDLEALARDPNKAREAVQKAISKTTFTFNIGPEQSVTQPPPWLSAKRLCSLLWNK